MPQKLNSALTTIYSPVFKKTSDGPTIPIYTTNVSNPPTDAELDSLFSAPDTDIAGWACIIIDSDSVNRYLVISTTSQWLYVQLSVAV